MAQLVPSVLLYGQALKLINELREGQEAGTLRDTDDLIAKLADILTRFEDTAGTPFLQYSPVVETEPPSSEKTNRLWRALEKDVNLLQQQMDILQASTSFSHNIVATEVMKSKSANARVSNKLKTLQLYTESVDSSIITFGDSFRSLEFTDSTKVPAYEQAMLLGEGYLTLAPDGEMVNLSEDATVTILDGSNGYLGNNHEVEDPGGTVDLQTGSDWYTFKTENRIYNDLKGLLDAEPNSWIEYEHYYLTEEQQRAGANLNFVYQKQNEDGSFENINWASGPGGGTLKLHLQFDLKSIKTLNSIEYTPYGLEENANPPVLIKYVETSPNGTDWTSIYPASVWLGTETNIQAARTADNVATEKAVWAFEARSVQYIRFHIEQPNPITCRVGHAYYVDEDTETFERVEGPIPPTTDPTKYYEESNHGSLLQQREFFIGKRWAVGIRDITLQQREYVERSVIVTKPLRVGGVVDRVALTRADILVPQEYSSDQSWVEFYVSPDDGGSWFQISRIEDDYLGIPEQIAFNDPTPEAFREAGVAYYNVDGIVTSLRLKIVLTRPDELVTTTPILRSYALKVKRR